MHTLYSCVIENIKKLNVAVPLLLPSQTSSIWSTLHVSARLFRDIFEFQYAKSTHEWKQLWFHWNWISANHVYIRDIFCYHFICRCGGCWWWGLGVLVVGWLVVGVVGGGGGFWWWRWVGGGVGWGGGVCWGGGGGRHPRYKPTVYTENPYTNKTAPSQWTETKWRNRSVFLRLLRCWCTNIDA